MREIADFKILDLFCGAGGMSHGMHKNPHFKTEVALDINEKLATQICEFMKEVRQLKLEKLPGIAETIDWAKGIALFKEDEEVLTKTLSCLLKSDRDIQMVRQEIF